MEQLIQFARAYWHHAIAWRRRGYEHMAMEYERMAFEMLSLARKHKHELLRHCVTLYLAGNYTPNDMIQKLMYRFGERTRYAKHIVELARKQRITIHS
jgi:hypothetical protein